MVPKLGQRCEYCGSSHPVNSKAVRLMTIPISIRPKTSKRQHRYTTCAVGGCSKGSGDGEEEVRGSINPIELVQTSGVAGLRERDSGRGDPPPPLSPPEPFASHSGRHARVVPSDSHSDCDSFSWTTTLLSSVSCILPLPRCPQVLCCTLPSLCCHRRHCRRDLPSIFPVPSLTVSLCGHRQQAARPLGAAHRITRGNSECGCALGNVRVASVSVCGETG